MKDIFKRLPQEKQDRVLDAFLKEFAYNDYENASITSVVKELGIAKGSVYQYFGSKMELYKTLWEICQTEKMAFVQGLNQDDFWDFWDFYKEAYVKGIRFDVERPMHSQFLYRASQDRSNPELEKMLREHYLKALAFFTEQIEKEQEAELITKEFDAEFVALAIMNQSRAIKEYLENVVGYDPQASIEASNTVFADAEEHIMKYVDQSIAFFKRAFSS